MDPRLRDYASGPGPGLDLEPHIHIGVKKVGVLSADKASFPL